MTNKYYEQDKKIELRRERATQRLKDIAFKRFIAANINEKITMGELHYTIERMGGYTGDAIITDYCTEYQIFLGDTMLFFSQRVSDCIQFVNRTFAKKEYNKKIRALEKAQRNLVIASDRVNQAVNNVALPLIFIEKRKG